MNIGIGIGIDLGTYYSCIAVYNNNILKVIPNKDGSYTTPSQVAFSGDEEGDIIILVGKSAKDQLVKNPYNSIYDIKRLIGRSFDTITEQEKRLYPFSIIDSKNTTTISVKHQGNIVNLSPEKISSLILKDLKESAEAYLGSPISNIVITTPAYFNDAQR